MVQMRRMTQPWHLNDRLWGLWELVGNNLTGDWLLSSLARNCRYCPEQLRRLCLRELGRNPMQRLTYVRMQGAQELIESSNDKLEVIAASVGCDGAIVFSCAFPSWIGRSQSSIGGGIEVRCTLLRRSASFQLVASPRARFFCDQ